MEQCLLPATDYRDPTHTVPTNYNLQHQNPSISCCSASSYNLQYTPFTTTNKKPSFIVLAKEENQVVPVTTCYQDLPYLRLAAAPLVS